MSRYCQPVRFDLASGLSSRQFLQFMAVAGSSALLSTALHGVRGIHAIACRTVIDTLSRISLDVDAVTQWMEEKPDIVQSWLTPTA